MTTTKPEHTNNVFLNTEIEYVFEKLTSSVERDSREYWQGRLDSLASIERARKMGVM